MANQGTYRTVWILSTVEAKVSLGCMGRGAGWTQVQASFNTCVLDLRGPLWPSVSLRGPLASTRGSLLLR